MAHTFDSLRGGSVARLAKLRAQALKLAANPHRNMTVAANPDWRTVRYSGFAGRYPAACPGWNEEGGRKLPILSGFSADAFPVREIRFADECEGGRSIKHRGWYADADGNGDHGVIRGIIARIPHGRILAGYHWSDNGEYVLFLSEVFSGEDAERDACSAADSHAEHYAEICREDDERFRAMQDAESIAEDKESTLREAIEAARLAWQARYISVRHLADAYEKRATVRELIAELREARETLAERAKEYERGE